MHALTQWRGFQNAITLQNSSFGNDRAKRSENSRGVSDSKIERRCCLSLARPRATSDRSSKSSFGGARQYFCQGVRRADVDVD